VSLLRGLTRLSSPARSGASASSRDTRPRTSPLGHEAGGGGDATGRDRLLDHASTDVQNWQVGQSFIGYNVVKDDGSNYYAVFSDLTLTSISKVPEPGGLTLLVAELIGLAVRARRLPSASPPRG
jgi:hypothetical protein